MSGEPWYLQRERKAAENLRVHLAKPIDEHNDMDDGVRFDPWEIVPWLYGTYGGDFDRCAIQVLEELRDGEKHRSDLGAEMFREMLCRAGLCDYGTSPRACFPTQQFASMLPELIDKWKAFSMVQWRIDVCADSDE
jgi:hypothetical protein